MVPYIWHLAFFSNTIIKKIYRELIQNLDKQLTITYIKLLVRIWGNDNADTIAKVVIIENSYNLAETHILINNGEAQKS